MEQQPATYHRAAAARARKLRAEATTRWLKEHLDDTIAEHEEIAEEIERASEPSTHGTATPDETAFPSAENPT